MLYPPFMMKVFTIILSSSTIYLLDVRMIDYGKNIKNKSNKSNKGC